MRLLHGSYTEILTPDLSKCKGKNDFGKGFYLTPNWKRAWQMGKRSAFLHGGKITVNAFLFYPNIGEKKGLQIKIFEGFVHKRLLMNSLKIENMGNKYNYENVLGEIACYIAKECNLTPSEAIGVVMNDECTDAVIEEIQKSDRIDIEALASRYLTEELC